MAEKEGGDSEKKMTKDFLDRWKKIASKYEGPEPEPVKEKEGQKPAKKPAEEADAFLTEMAQKGEAEGPKPQEGKKGADELDDLLAEFGFADEVDEEEAETVIVAPDRPGAEAKAPAPGGAPAKAGAAGPATPAAPAAPAPTASPTASPDDAQRRVLDTLKKVGLVRPEAEPAKAPPAEPPASAPDEEEEDTLLLELESLLTPVEAVEGAGAKRVEPSAAKGRAALEEEDLISELEGLLEGEGEQEEEKKPAPAVAKVAPVVAPVAPPVSAKGPEAAKPEPAYTITPQAAASKAPPPEIMPPAAAKPRAEAPATVSEGRVNGGRVNGGRVNGGRVNGGRVNGGRVNGGRVNGGRVNGGRVNGGRVNGGRVNGGLVNGGRRLSGADLPPVLRAQFRRQAIASLAVAAVVVAGLLAVIPLGSTPHGPAVDGDIADWQGKGALFFSDSQDSGVPPALDLREYAVRADGGHLWFEAQAAGPFFTRPGPFSARADDLLVLFDLDGSNATGYAYQNLGVDRVVEVYGWNGAIQGSSTRAWVNGSSSDFSGFGSAGGLQVALRGDRIEGELMGLASGSFANVRAAFELRGLDGSGAERLDAAAAPATLAVPMVSIVLSNPSPLPATFSGLRAVATYGSTPPADPGAVAVWRDTNDNRLVEPSSDTILTQPSTPLQQGIAANLAFAQPLIVAAGARVPLLLTLQHVPTGAANGTPVQVGLAAPGEFTVDQQTSVERIDAPVAAQGQPLSYIGAAPSSIAVDGNTADWAGRTGGSDPAGDVADSHIDLTSLKGNITAVQASFLVSFQASPLEGALVPIKLASTVTQPQSPCTSCGGPPVQPPANKGADLLWLMIDGDGNASTGLSLGGHGYEYAVYVEGKGGHVLPGGAILFQWDGAPPAGAWSPMPQAPLVGVGALALELGVALPPLVLTARNVTVTAYATDWQSARDDFAQPLVVGNDQGSRGAVVLPPDPSAAPEGLVPLPVRTPIPEFGDAAVPVAGLAFLMLFGRRRRLESKGV